MAFRITITTEAESQLRALTVRQQRILEAAVQARLVERPKNTSRHIKKLGPNPLVEFELRAGDLRALYNVEDEEVIVLVVGRKVGNKLIVNDQEFYGHQDDSTKPPKGESEGDAG